MRADDPTDDSPSAAQAGAPSLDLDRPFTRRQLRQAGGDVRILRGQDFVQILPRVWVRKNRVDLESLIVAALSLHPASAYASHLSAAFLLGLPVPDHGFAHVTVARPADRRFRPQVKPHVTTRRRRVWTVRGIRVTDPIATFIDCAGWLSFVDLVVLGDALCRSFKIDPSTLSDTCARSTDYYAKQAHFAATFVRSGVDSPMETRLRLLIVLAGLPEPTVNHTTYQADGRWKRRYDLCYLGIKLIIEYDGRQHVERVEQWEKDVERREEFDDEGFRVLVVTAKGIYREPERTLRRIRRQLVLRGMPDVPEIDDRWREHFAA